MKTIARRKILTCLMFLLVISSTLSVVDAHSDAEGVVKERMTLMEDLADAMKAMGVMFKGEAVFEAAIVTDKAGLLVDHANKIPIMTPEGSNNHPSEALPLIWEAWDGYVASAKELAEASAKLADMAENDAGETETKLQYLKVRETCGSCHDRFRKPKA